MRAVVNSAVLVIASATGAHEMNFLVMGDWGGSETAPYTTKGEVNTASAMDKAAAALGAEFALVLGDNFYSHGISGDWSDARFQTTFEQCFAGDSLSNSSGFQFHVVAGNHDHRGNVQAQIDYSSHSARWNFPSYYYKLSKTAPDGATLDVLMIDTVQLSGNSQLNDEDTDSLRGSELPGPLDPLAADAQIQWIDETLKASTADFIIVAGHYPVFSIAEHGPTKQLQPDSFPYLRENKVSTYLCGHEHNEQFIDVGDGIQYHVIGSAHVADSSTAHASTISSDQLKFHGTPDGGFAGVTVSKVGMVVKHFDGAGKLLFTAPAIAPRGSTPTPTPAPTPAPTPTGSWECQSNKLAKVGNDDDLQGTGSDISSCKSACEATSDCKAIYWHKSDSHCHVLTGSFSHDNWSKALESDSDHDSCFRSDVATVVV